MAMNPIPWQEIRREYLDGATYQELGEKYGIAPSTIGRRRHKEQEVALVAHAYIDAEIAVVAQKTDDLVREMMHIHHHFRDAGSLKTLNDTLQRRLAAHIHQRFGKSVGERAQTRAQTCGKYHGFHGRMLLTG